MNLDQEGNEGRKDILTYNSDGTVLVTSYSGNYTTQTTLEGKNKVYFTDGEVSKDEYFNPAGILLKTVTYSDFDGKNNPFKNILGFNKISFFDDFTPGISQNYSKVTTKFGSEPASIETYISTYNSNNYPITEIYKQDGETVSTSQYFY